MAGARKFTDRKKPKARDAYESAVASLERTITTLVRLLVSDEPTHVQEAAVTLSKMGPLGIRGLEEEFMRTEDVCLQHQIAVLMQILAARDGLAVLEPLRRMIGRDLDPSNCVAIRQAFMEAISHAARQERCAVVPTVERGEPDPHPAGR